MGLIFTLIFSLLFLSSDRQQAKTSDGKVKTEDQTMPNLSGEKAEEYLKEQGLHKSLGEAMAASRYSIYPTKNAPIADQKEVFEAKNPRQAFSTYFAKDGVHLISKAEDNKWRIKMNLTGYGYGDDITNVEQIKTEVQKKKSRIEITKSQIANQTSQITEWYENSASGLEQGWTINEKQANANDDELKLVLELGGDLKAKLAADKQAIDFVRANDEAVVRYDKLKSWDASGKELPSRMELNNETLSIVVDDKNAKYPITVDPFLHRRRN